MEGEDELSGGPTMIEDEIVASGIGANEEKRRTPAISGEQLDVEGYASLYSGRTKIVRLLFIADRYGSEANQNLQLEALRMAFDEIKKGENTQFFREVVKKINGRLGSNYQMDTTWCETVDRRAEQKKEKLENELNAYRSLHWRINRENEGKHIENAKVSASRSEAKEHAEQLQRLQQKARIDSHDKILYARHADQRNATFQRVLQTGSEFDQNVRSMLLRSNLVKHEYDNQKALRKL